LRGVNHNESQTVCETHLREVQSDQAQGSHHDYLRKPEAQAEAGLIQVFPKRKILAGRLAPLAQPASAYTFIQIFT
jgi:hypothetical protein